MTGKATIEVEVVYARPQRQELITLTVPDGTTVAGAIAASGIEARFPDEDLTRLPTGIWGRRAERGRRLADGDRVEIYRPLRMDPREARRRLAAHGKAMGQHDDEA